MLDDFFVRALIAGAAVALVAGPFGCLIVWRRMAYFGNTMAHSALLGAVLAVLLEVDAMLGVFVVAAAVALALVLLRRWTTLAEDSLLGILAHATLALGLVLAALLVWVRIDLIAYLFGDILAVSRLDIAIVTGGGALLLGALALVWRPLLAATVSTELAAAEGMHPERARIVFMVLMAALIAIAMKIIGILLITSLLIIPAATARRFAHGPEQMAAVAAGLGVLAVVGGLFGSLRLDTPSGPSIVVAALALFLASLVVPRLSPAEPIHGAPP